MERYQCQNWKCVYARQVRLEEFADERLARNEAFCGLKRQVTLYLQFYGSES